jgi:RES domain-containing protein
MEVFRLVREKNALPLSGKGAAIKGARWNSIGVELIYTAMNRSLAMAEVAVHLTFATIPDDYVMMKIHIPDKLRKKVIDAKDLPTNWNDFPYPSTTQKIGDDFVLGNKYCVLLIPSAVTQGDFNILINPNHKDFKQIRIMEMVKFPFDKRIFK